MVQVKKHKFSFMRLLRLDDGTLYRRCRLYWRLLSPIFKPSPLSLRHKGSTKLWQSNLHLRCAITRKNRLPLKPNRYESLESSMSLIISNVLFRLKVMNFSHLSNFHESLPMAAGNVQYFPVKYLYIKTS